MKTRRENDIPGCVPGTRREGVHEGAPATRREGPGDAGATRRESTGTYGLSAYGNQLGRQSRMLPEELTTRYLPLRELSGGTQSDVMVVEDRETGEEAVVKMYRQPGNPYDLATSTKLDRADAKHVVRVTDRGSSDGFAWEVQEYCVYGTLTNVESLRRPLSPAQFRVVVAELGTALIHLHELSIVHRDLKPGNVLVRSIDPLDLVLADFGLAKEVALSMDVGSVGGTFLYMPPEAFIGEFGSASDWWALGVMAYELLAGHHFFLEPSSRIPNEDKIRHDIATGNYTIERVGDDRQWLLLRGLLTRDRKNRWGSAQFTEWLAGSSPAVIEDKTPDLSETRGPQLAHTFAGTVVRTPEELAAAIRNNWDAAGAEIAGRPSQALIGWLSTFPHTAQTKTLLVSGRPPAPILVALQGLLDPATPAEFRGVPLSGFGERIQAGLNGDHAAQTWAAAVRIENPLDGFGLLGDATAASAQHKLRDWTTGLNGAVETLSGHRKRVRDALLPFEPQLLAAALGDDSALRAQAQTVLSSTQTHGWSASATENAQYTGNLGAMVVGMVALQMAVAERDLANRLAAEQAAERQRQAAIEVAEAHQLAIQEAERERREHWRRSLRSSVVARLALGALWCVFSGWTALAAISTAATEAPGTFRSMIVDYIPTTAVAILISIAAEAILVRRPSTNGILVIVGFFIGLNGMFAPNGTFNGLPTILPLFVAGGWVLALVLSWLIAQVAHAADGETTPKPVPTERRLSTLSAFGGAIAGGFGLLTWIFVIAPPAGSPASLTARWEFTLGLSGWFAETIPAYDPFLLAVDPFRLAMVGLVGFLLAALREELRSLARPLVWVSIVGAVLAGLVTFFAAPWMLPVAFFPILVSGLSIYISTDAE